MSNSQDQGRAPSPWSNKEQNGIVSSSSVPYEPDLIRRHRGQGTNNHTGPVKGQSSGGTSGSARPSERINLPARASTLGTPGSDRNPSSYDLMPLSRSEDLNHGSPTNSYNGGISGSSPRPPYYNTSSRPETPQRLQSSNSQHSDESDSPGSVASFSSANSGSSSGVPKPPPTTSSSTSTTLVSSTCSACGNLMQGAFVRALGTVFHLGCFKCMDCGDVVASKFFPIEGPDGKQHPLCERDYFRRLNLICAKCGMALRGSYITACSKKYHVEHFTCSLCPTLFGPQDSYYEHDGDVYCHFHYSTRFATKCAGCNSAILKQFVEINRNMRDECWHPECYMINKFWNVKVVARRPTSTASELEDSGYMVEEQRETPTSLKEKQVKMEQQVYRIWTVLSAFEESSAACISDMLRQVSNGQYLDAIRMAEKFILHVEVLFGAIDDLEFHFSRLNMKGMSHVREARMLCRKTVDLFTLLSHTQETGSRRMGMTQELLALVTGLAHYLKILIRIALTGALKLERENSVREAMSLFLDKLHLLAVQGGNPTARRVIRGANGEVLAQSRPGNLGTEGVTYGFRSLAPENAGESPFSSNAPRDAVAKFSASNPPSDLCVKCNLTVEEDCVRLGTYQRWHSHCVRCANCGKVAAVPAKEQSRSNSDEKDAKDAKDGKEKEAPKLSTVRRPPANVGMFVYEVDSRKEPASGGDTPAVIFCVEHGHQGCRPGFQAVSRLEQYAFLLNVALRRLYLLLKKQGVVPLSPVTSSENAQSQPALDSDPYQESDILRMKSVHLDRKLSATARLPKRSTIVESPAGKSAPSGVISTQRSQELGMTPQRIQVHPAQMYQDQQGQQGQLQPRSQNGSQQYLGPAQQSPRPPGRQPGYLETNQQNQILRPSFARNNTEVKIVDESTPNSPAGGPDENVPPVDNGITLADIPQLMEAAQAREQRRSLPRLSAIPYIAELTPLELMIVKHAAVLALHKSPLKDQFDLDEILELVEVKKGGFWNKLFKPGNDKKNVKKKGVFGVPLDLLVEREGSDSLLGSTRETLRVPSFIDDVISAMRQMDMSVEGIFRKNGNIRRLKDLAEAIDRDPSSVELSQDNPVQLAALLKKFLRDLPDPLMTFKLHRLFIASQSLPQDEDRNRLLHMVGLILPKSHRDTMEVIFVFLKWVASFAHMDEETGSKMDLGNLATVVCPSILYSRGRDAVRDESFGAIRVVTALLENQDQYFTVPEEFLPILHDQEYFANSMELTSKEFLKKVDTYIRVKASGRMPTSLPIQNPNHPRYQPMQSADRPATASSERNNRAPHPGMPQQNASYSVGTSSPSIPPSTPAIPSRGPGIEDWAVPGPRPPPQEGYASSRPSSFIGPSRPTGDVSQPSSNGLPPAALRQRT